MWHLSDVKSNILFQAAALEDGLICMSVKEEMRNSEEGKTHLCVPAHLFMM